MGSNKVMVWVGRVISLLVSGLFIMSAVMKFMNGPEVKEGMAKLGLPDTMVFPLAVLELACVVVYLVPPTAVLGAILLTGYLGGAICTHWRVGDPFLLHIAIGVAIWAAIYLREPRLRGLIPVRTPPPPD